MSFFVVDQQVDHSRIQFTEFRAHKKGFPLLFSASPTPVWSTLCLPAEAPCIIHQPDFEGLFSEEIISLKKSLMGVSIKEAKEPWLVPLTVAKISLEGTRRTALTSETVWTALSMLAC